MGFLDVLRGKRELKQPAPDRLFAMSTAYVKLEMELNITTTGKAAIVFQPLATADFEQLVRDMEEIVRSTGSENDGSVESTDDEHGYRWMVIGDPDFEDLVVGVNAVSNEIQGGGYGDRILAAVFAFRDDKPASRSTGSTTTSAAPSTRSCRPAASSSATTSASCG